MPTLPVQPEPISELKARLPAALASVFVAGNTGPDRPGTKRHQVFDTTDGLRFIISREYEATSRQTLLHVSVSAAIIPVAVAMQGERMATAYVLGRVVDLFTRYGELTLLHTETSKGGVVHFIFEDIPVK